VILPLKVDATLFIKTGNTYLDTLIKKKFGNGRTQASSPTGNNDVAIMQV
jgi:hypothetical protein